jgi:hypothetical protein|tara:strand:+ start:2708 stop:3682 length:975 start_codon:yes stop_codon:yes gene_type:complete
MAISVSAGYGNLPTGNFQAEIYSQKVLKFFRRASVIEDITNTDYAGEIENFGDTVRIMKEPTVTISAYSRGSVVTPQDLADDEIQLTVDQAQAFAFKVDDIEERQSHVNFEALATSSGAFSLKRNYDKNVLQAMIDGAGIAGANGATETDANLGTAGTPVTIAGSDAGDDVVNLMALMARKLDEQDVPEENRWFVAPPIVYQNLYAAGAKIVEVQVTGDASSPLRNGLVTNQKIMGFNLYKSNALRQSVDATTTTDMVSFSGVATGENTVLAGHISGMATANSIAKTEVIRDPDSFSDVVRGLHVYGRKVIRPEAICLGIVDYS